MKNSSLNRQKVKSTFCVLVSRCSVSREGSCRTYVVGVIHLQDPTPRLVDLLVTLVAPAHAQRRVHVHVMTGQVEGDQALENDAPAREGARQEDQQTRGGAAVRHHVEDGAELGGLLEMARGDAVEGVEQAGYAVCGCASAGVQRHVVEGCDGKDDAAVACARVSGEGRERLAPKYLSN